MVSLSQSPVYDIAAGAPLPIMGTSVCKDAINMICELL